MKFTHKGWYGFCPIYYRVEEDGSAGLMPRKLIPDWVFSVSHYFITVCIFTLSVFDKDYEPSFPIYLTGELDGN